MVCRPSHCLLVACVFAFVVAHPARAGVIINGSFETPSISGSFLSILAGSEPPGFGWQVTSNSVDIVTTGVFGTAFDGNQFLDLDGFAPGSILESIATTPGIQYALTFMYANNPFGPGGIPPPDCPFGTNCATIPATAQVSVWDSNTNSQLITPLLLTHGNSTAANLNWASPGAIAFVAIGTTTTLSFLSLDPNQSDGGIFLDAISVTAVPEPGMWALLGTALIALIGLHRKVVSKQARLSHGRERPAKCASGN
jgi:hypothetical protein